MTTTSTRRKPRRFTTGAKVAATTVAVTALLGGWNLIGHLEAAQAANKAGAQSGATTDSTVVKPSLMLPTVTPTPAATPELRTFAFAPIPTLAPASDLLQATAPDLSNGGGLAAIALPPLQALAPLPTMEPLPALPALPPPPAASSGGGGNGGGGGGGSQQSGGS